MKNLLLLAALGVLGYFAYQEWRPASSAAPLVAATPTPTPTPEPIDPAVLSKVSKLFEEWKLRNAGTERKQLGSAYKTDMAQLVSEIKLRGPYTDEGLKSLFQRFLAEQGRVDKSEIESVAESMIREAGLEGSLGGMDKYDR
jgi:hypothetical protein